MKSHCDCIIMMIEPYILLALLAAVMLGLYSVTIKFLLRYRLCSPTLITISYCIAAGILSFLVVFSFGYRFPQAIWPYFLVTTATTLIGHLLLALAMQEADASTVVPLLGLKIPFSAVLAFLFLGESYPASIYIAVVIAATAVLLFGMGRPAAAQGGHGKNPVIGILLATASALVYSIGDMFVKKSLVYIEPLQLVLWINIGMILPCTGLVSLPVFRKYIIKPFDIAGFILCAILFTGGAAIFFTSFKISGSITTPNIILATRGFIALFVGFILNKILRVPIERQSNKIYLLRLVATLMLFTSLAIILLQQ